jgi:ATP-dependent Clp protease, protease subunit
MALPKEDTEDSTVSQSLQDKGMFVLMDEINSESVKPAIEWILYENFVVKKRKKELLLMICSEGGDTASAFALIDVMRSSAIPIKTVGLGMITSSGLMIFIAGAAGRRVITPNTSIMSHQFTWFNEGKAHELFATIKEFELMQHRMLSHYRACTGLSDQDIREKLLPAQDVWLSAQDALELNVCDHISNINS